MFDVVELFKTMAENSNLKTVSERNDGGYIGKDGLIYCGKCHSPRQCKTELLESLHSVNSLVQHLVYTKVIKM